MIIATIKKLDGTHLDHGRFTSEEAALSWFQPFIDKGVYGQKHVPEREVPAVLDINGDEISPAYISPEIAAAFIMEIAEETKSQGDLNSEALEFLKATDWKCLRHTDQLNAGLPLSLTEQEYIDLLIQRQAARNSIVR